MNVEELKGELNELEPELKATQDEGNRLTQALAQHRNQVAQLRDQMVAQEDRVKVGRFGASGRECFASFSVSLEI